MQHSIRMSLPNIYLCNYNIIKVQTMCGLDGEQFKYIQRELEGVIPVSENEKNKGEKDLVLQ